ncbi:sensor histidine kinase [Streptomyces sp. NPDC001380]|uniref:sensor histidine kinase n=1 Tax=Streptomyces sp. NPDC001380 TaxID=3364566 RepID=UPI0036B96D7A
MLLSVLPPGVVALAGAATTALAAGGRLDSAEQGAVFGGAALLGAVAAGVAGMRASAEARTVSVRWAQLSRSAGQERTALDHERAVLERDRKAVDRDRAALDRDLDALEGLVRAVADGRAGLAELRRGLEEGGHPVRPRREPSPLPGPDALSRLGHEIAEARREAETAVLEAAARAGGEEHGARLERFEVFANLARRLESLVHREIGLLDDLENEVEDPDLLKGLFRVDHLSTRIRRYAENLAVLGGAGSHRQWTRPVGLTDVLRSAVAEIDQYARVKLVPPIEGAVGGHAVVDVVHLLAELVENATVYSPPHTVVQLRVEPVTAGVAIEVEDRGLGMSPAERGRMNALLSSPDTVALGDLLQDGRIGLYVVAALARRHGIAVRLQSNVYGGTQAVVVLPPALLGAGSAGEPEHRPEPAARAASAPAAVPAQAPAPREPGRTPDPDAAPAPAHAAVPASSPGQRAATEPRPGPAPAADGRPPLPRRRRREDDDAAWRQPPRASAAPEDVEHDPGLMAAFRSGFSLAEEAGASGPAGES